MFIILGFGQSVLNWGTDEWRFQPVSLLLFGSGFYSGPLSPWIVSLSLPVGALVFLARHKKVWR